MEGSGSASIAFTQFGSITNPFFEIICPSIFTWLTMKIHLLGLIEILNFVHFSKNLPNMIQMILSTFLKYSNVI